MEGAYDAGTGKMYDSLRTNSLIPVNQPFNVAPWNYSGTDTVSTAVLTVSDTNAVVDWVLVRYFNPEDSMTLTIPGLVQKDGDVIDGEGGHLKLPNVYQKGYISIVHRNHLGVMTANTLSLSTSSTTYDFTGSASNAFGGSNGINDLGNGYFGLFSGDFDINAQIQNTDVTNLLPTIGNSGYLPGDLNMNGQVQNTDLQLKLYPNLGRGQQF